jgi:membrane fusion protein, multidrug efflux system
MQFGALTEHSRLLFPILDDLCVGGPRRGSCRPPTSDRDWHRQDFACPPRRLSGAYGRVCLRNLASMAELKIPKNIVAALRRVHIWLGSLIALISSSETLSRVRVWLGRLVAFAAIAAALGLGGYTIYRLDQRPRTHDAFLYADTAGLAPDVSGRIIKLHVHDNQRVSKGDLLVEIDAEPFELRLRQARAQVAALQAQIELTTRQVGAQSTGADAAATQVGRARSQLALARDTVQRLTPLLGKGYVTPQQIDEARTNERTAQAALTAAIQQARQARQAIGDTESLMAQLVGAEAAVALAERDLRNATVPAPFDGLVVGLDIAEGTYAAAGHPLFTLIKSDEWYAVGNFRETELSQIAIGDPVTVWLMSDNNHPISGHVESLGWGVRPADGGGPALPAVGRTLSWVVVAQRFPVRIRLDTPPEAAMRIGATVSILVRHGAAE